MAVGINDAWRADKEKMGLAAKVPGLWEIGYSLRLIAVL